VADSSLSNEIELTSKESDSTSSSNKKLNSSIDRLESLDKLNDEEDTSWKSTGNANDEDEDLTSRVDAEALIGYTLSGNDKYQCLLCTFYRKNIVHHYKMQHPKKEVLISRLPVHEAQLAIQESAMSAISKPEPEEPSKRTGKYSCRFCTFVTKGIDSCARENFYEHCTNHTGEYRFSCMNCSYEAVARGSIRTHYYKECRKYTTTKSFNEAMIESPIPDEDGIYGYLCSKCNFVQLKRCNVEKHARMWHGKSSEQEVKIVKINMSLRIKKDVNESINVKVESDINDKSLVQKLLEPKNEKPSLADISDDVDRKQDIAITDTIEVNIISFKPFA
jgi:hypothetical protein